MLQYNVFHTMHQRLVSSLNHLDLSAQCVSHRKNTLGAVCNVNELSQSLIQCNTPANQFQLSESGKA